MKKKSSSVVNIGSNKQLFIDDRWFDSQNGIKLTINPPLRRAKVNWPGFDPWDSRGIHAYLSVIEDNGLFRMWYGGSPAGVPFRKGILSTCYAESKNGIDWYKPELDYFAMSKYPHNNIIMPGTYGSVMKDSNGPDEHRYKALCNIFPNHEWEAAYDSIHGEKMDDGSISYFMATYLLTSPDGLHWTRCKNFASPFFHDSQNQLLYDRRLQKYVAYVRWKTAGLPRSVARYEIDRLFDLPWPHEENPAAAKGPGGTLERTGDELRTVIRTYPGKADPPDTDIYCPCVTQYPWADSSYYFSFMPLYRHYPVGDTSNTVVCDKDKKGHPSNDGPIDVRLACSADGINWTRSSYDAYLRLGTDWDSGGIYAAPGLIRKGNEIWQYYVGLPVTHGYNHSGSVGLAVQRLDGFISADADASGEASFTTPLFTFEGAELRLNIDCSALGSARVAICDESNNHLPGFALDDCETIDLNHLEIPVKWRGKTANLKGKAVRLHFRLNDCKLYSFQFIK